MLVDCGLGKVCDPVELRCIEAMSLPPCDEDLEFELLDIPSPAGLEEFSVRHTPTTDELWVQSDIELFRLSGPQLESSELIANLEGTEFTEWNQIDADYRLMGFADVVGGPAEDALFSLKVLAVPEGDYEAQAAFLGAVVLEQLDGDFGPPVPYLQTNSWIPTGVVEDLDGDGQVELTFTEREYNFTYGFDYQADLGWLEDDGLGAPLPIPVDGLPDQTAYPDWRELSVANVDEDPELEVLATFRCANCSPTVQILDRPAAGQLLEVSGALARYHSARPEKFFAVDEGSSSELLAIEYAVYGEYAELFVFPAATAPASWAGEPLRLGYGRPTSLTAGRFDGDEGTDIAIEYPAGLLIYRRAGDGVDGCTTVLELPVGDSSIAAAGDFDGDGVSELVLITDDEASPEKLVRFAP